MGVRMKVEAYGAARPPVPRSLHDVRQHTAPKDGSPVHGGERVRLRGSHTDAGGSPSLVILGPRIRSGTVSAAAPGSPDRRATRLSGDDSGDRKSTRLNSSH